MPCPIRRVAASTTGRCRLRAPKRPAGRSPNMASETPVSRGSKALKYALQQVGDVYVWAAAGPTRWDCSGLTMRAFQQAGVSLPHSSRIQIRYGKSISSRSLKPGDLVFFGKPISHVAMYMGGGKMVHAPRPGKRVEVTNFTMSFGRKPFVGARRL